MEDENTNKQVDGLKKLSGEKLAKSRKIVLETIGEETAWLKTGEPASPLIKLDKKIDALSFKPGKQPPAECETDQKNITGSEDEKKFVSRKFEVLKELKIDPGLTTKAPIMAGRPAEKTAAEPLVKQKEEKNILKKYAPDFKNIKPLVDNFFGSKNKVGREKAFLSLAPVLPKKEKKPLTGQNMPAKTELSVMKKLLPAASQKNYSENFLKFIVRGRTNAGNFFSKLKQAALNILKIIPMLLLKVLFIGFCAFFGFVIIYFLFILAVIKFNLDNNYLRTINNYLPIPAIISRSGIISYYAYKDFATKMSDNYAPNKNADITGLLIDKLVLRDLTVKYKIPPLGSDFESLKLAVSKAMAYDPDINRVAISRVKKIEEMIKDGGNYNSVFEKYGDELGEKILPLTKISELEYGNGVKDLLAGQISQVIVQPEGYYIFYCRGKDQDSLALRYVFIKARSWEEVMQSQRQNFKYISMFKNVIFLNDMGQRSTDYVTNLEWPTNKQIISKIADFFNKITIGLFKN